MKISELNNQLNIKRIIIWGLRTSYNDTLHFIQRGFFVTLKKLDIPVIWVNDDDKNRNLIQDNDLIIATNSFGHSKKIFASNSSINFKYLQKWMVSPKPCSA